MGKILSRLCPCLGRETSINNEDVVIRTDFSQYTETEYKEYNCVSRALKRSSSRSNSCDKSCDGSIYPKL